VRRRRAGVRVPHGWLAEFLGDALPDVETTVQLLDGLGLAVETVHALPAAPAGDGQGVRGEA